MNFVPFSSLTQVVVEVAERKGGMEGKRGREGERTVERDQWGGKEEGGQRRVNAVNTVLTAAP